MTSLVLLTLQQNFLKFISKVPNLLSGLKQAYLRTPNTPAGLGIAFEKAVKRNPHGMALLFEDQKLQLPSPQRMGKPNWALLFIHWAKRVM